MEKIKNFLGEHKTKVVVVGGVILTAATNAILKKGSNQNIDIDRPIDKHTDCTKEQVLDFINGADDNLKYTIFKEGDSFGIVNQ